MSAKIILQAGGDKSLLHQTYLPNVRFQIPSENRSRDYVWQIVTLWADFIRSLSTHKSNIFCSDRGDFVREVGQEGGTGGFYIGEEYFDHCKMYIFDGETGRVAGNWKGILLRNHEDQRSKVEPLYLLSEKFEEFLRSRFIPYQRFGRRIGDTEECEQVTE